MIGDALCVAKSCTEKSKPEKRKASAGTAIAFLNANVSMQTTMHFHH